jgi:CRISPR-associated protein Cmr2
MSSWQLPEKYWEKKIQVYLHDPLDKMREIHGHEERANAFLDEILSSGERGSLEDWWKTADHIAAGADRGRTLGFSWNEQQDGSVAYGDRPEITHPLGEEKRLRIENSSQIPSTGGSSSGGLGSVKNLQVRERFFYLHLLYRYYLGENADLGAFWHVMPADSRFPDHSIWNHNALTSAIYSSALFEQGDYSNIGLMVVSFGPVQSFIEQARKLRDYWTGSVLLSWLTFEGLKWVMENLGPDHVLYPSLVGQPLVVEYLKRWELPASEAWVGESQKRIASLPNKFVVLIPYSKAQEIGRAITQAMEDAWNNLSNEVMKKVQNKTDMNIEAIWKRQTEKIWEIRWAAVNLLSITNNTLPQQIKDLIDKEISEKVEELAKQFHISGEKSEGLCYAASHNLVQSTLAAAKAYREAKASEEPGEKCPQCGEREILHVLTDSYNSAKEYKGKLSEFWDKFRSRWKQPYDFDEGEKLCAVCLLKRILYKSLPDGHILSSVLSGAEGFPSSTEIALYHFFKNDEKGKAISDKKEFSQKLHSSSKDEVKGYNLKPQDKYYALLLMDGDHMGDLVNGKNIAATWKSILHSAYLEKLNSSNFSDEEKKKWQVLGEKSRPVTPAVHAALSEALGDFSLYCVPEIVEKHEGRLIYAGGDDVFAVLPLGNALKAAQEIREAYHRFYYVVQKSGNQEYQTKEIAEEKWTIEKGRLARGLGEGEKISISGAILVCHHKEPLQAMVREVHFLLKKYAKGIKKGGRNALAIELKKRSGGSRYFYAKWDSPVWKAFENLAFGAGKSFSTRKVYQLSNYRDGIEVILGKKDRSLLEKFLVRELKHSEVKGNAEEVAGWMATILMEENNLQLEEKLDAFVMAAFLGGNDDK